jgi:hypothetical protein
MAKCLIIEIYEPAIEERLVLELRACGFVVPLCRRRKGQIRRRPSRVPVTDLEKALI